MANGNGKRAVDDRVLMKFVRKWWTWSTGSGWNRKLVGFGIPVFVALIVFGAAIGSEEESAQDSGQGSAAGATGPGLDVAPSTVSRPIQASQSDPSTSTPEPPTATQAPPTETTEPPTPTPEPPTATPPTPTATPAPAVYQGAGDDVISIQPGLGLLYITGNAASRHFAVKGYDSFGNSTELFVNTTDPYEGIVPLDFRSADETNRLEVTATGGWYIEVRPISSARTINAPGSLNGSGDEVLFVLGQPDTAVISGNSDAHHFAVIAWSSRSNLLVNTTDPYQGRVIVPRDTLLLEVVAEGGWEIVLE